MKELIDMKGLLDEFKSFIETDEGKKWKKEREEREERYSKLLSGQHVTDLTESEFRTIIKSLWASNFWGNKDWITDKILKQNDGVGRIAACLSNLLYGEGSLHSRYDTFRQSVKHIGQSMLTELIAFVEPRKYCIWNEKPKSVLPFLKMDNLLPDKVFKYQISGKEYESCINILSKLREELKAVIKDPDFIHVDFLLAFVFYKILPSEEPLLPTTEEKPAMQTVAEMLSHTSAQKALVDLGNLLGFDTYVPPEDRNKVVDGVKLDGIVALKEIPQFTYPNLLDTAKHIDVMWFREEFPVYCFEVEESTDVTKGLLRLYQIRKQGITPIIAGPENKKNKFLTEIEKDPFKHIKTQYKFISYEELSNFLQIARKYFEQRKRLLGET